MEGSRVTLELRYILERMRNRLSIARSLSETAWWPKNVDIPPGNRFLVVAPHPDDDAIGCGGTILKLVRAGKSVRIVYLSIQSSPDFSKQERLAEIMKSLDILGVKDFSFLSERFPPEYEIASVLKEELTAFKPDAVFVPSPLENHDEHIETFKGYAELRKSRPWEEETILYEVWTPLISNMIIDVSQFIDQKLEAVAAHKTQTRDLDYVRAVEGLNSYRAAISARKGHCEAFLLLNQADFLRTFPP